MACGFGLRFFLFCVEFCVLVLGFFLGFRVLVEGLRFWDLA